MSVTDIIKMFQLAYAYIPLILIADIAFLLSAMGITLYAYHTKKRIYQKGLLEYQAIDSELHQSDIFIDQIKFYTEYTPLMGKSGGIMIPRRDSLNRRFLRVISVAIIFFGILSCIEPIIFLCLQSIWNPTDIGTMIFSSIHIVAGITIVFLFSIVLIFSRRISLHIV